MAYNLIYIDDEDTKSINSDALSKGDCLKIKAIPPSSLEKTRDLVLQDKGNLDGIILDLKLDGNKSKDEFATYTAPSLAQAIRSKFTDHETGGNFEVPIFLLTSQENILKYYHYDLTSHDLFDYIFNKQALSKDNNYIQKICGIIDTYKFIQEKDFNLNEIMTIDLAEINQLIFPSKFYEKEELTCYKVSSYILKNIIGKPGVLINDKILASRLGIDIENSPEFDKIKSILNEKVFYKGVFSNVFSRWWSHRLINWWREQFPDNASLIRLEAEERVNLLKAKFGIEKITFAKPIDKATGTKFWTICQALIKPLDIKDGILLDDYEAKTWQDKLYISLESILERRHIHKGLKIHPSEKERVEELKKGF